ncbi:hypothetical protein N9878_01610, partial [bacterium]|nr:hypothetical protein [bacterium]
GDAIKAVPLLEQGNFGGIADFYQHRADTLGRFKGASSKDSIDIANMARAAQNGDPAAIEQLTARLGQAASVGSAMGLGAPKGAGFTLGEGQSRYDAKGNVIATGKKTQDNKEWLKEQRQTASSSTKTIKKRAGEINTAYAKLEGLGDQMRKGGSGARAAIGAGLMSVARLISPGVVTDSDFKALSGAADPLQTAISIIAGGKNGASVMEQMQKSIDVTNPDTFDVDALMDLAGSVIAAESPSLFNQWDESKAQAGRAGLSKAALNTFYGGKNRELERLRGLKPSKSAGGGASLGASGLPDGATATGPNGQKIKSVNGQWVPQ